MKKMCTKQPTALTVEGVINHLDLSTGFRMSFKLS